MKDYDEGKLLGQKERSKYECKASAFKELRNLPLEETKSILKKVKNSEIGLPQVNKEARSRKQLLEVRQAVLESLGEDSWDEVKEK